MQHIVEQSNLYSVQKNFNNNLKLSPSELEQFIGSLLAMSLVKLSNSRKYWSGKLNCPLVAEVISGDRWEQIKSNLHFNDNYNCQTNKNHPNYDKLFKICPFITHLADKFKKILKPQRLCVYEQMIPFKGISFLKQYTPLKPVKWGYKVHCLCGADGIMHDFIIYSGKIEPLPNEPDLGASSNIKKLGKHNTKWSEPFAIFWQMVHFSSSANIFEEKRYSLLGHCQHKPTSRNWVRYRQRISENWKRHIPGEESVDGQQICHASFHLRICWVCS